MGHLFDGLLNIDTQHVRIYTPVAYSWTGFANSGNDPRSIAHYGGQPGGDFRHRNGE